MTTVESCQAPTILTIRRVSLANRGGVQFTTLPADSPIYGVGRNPQLQPYLIAGLTGLPSRAIDVLIIEEMTPIPAAAEGLRRWSYAGSYEVPFDVRDAESWTRVLSVFYRWQEDGQ